MGVLLSFTFQLRLIHTAESYKNTPMSLNANMSKGSISRLKCFNGEAFKHCLRMSGFLSDSFS